jgi:glycosyltransferase involved in cell wall biosynthesis
MKITIITANFNNGITLQETIDSVSSQTYEAVEHIIIDGGSKDNSREILMRNSSRIKYISEPDKGLYDALNKGIALATGEVIGTLGADDYYPNNYVLERVAKAFESNAIDALYGDKLYVDPKKTTRVVRLWKAGGYHKRNWYYGWMPPHLSFYLKRSCFENFGNYNTNFKCSGDYELMLRMLLVNDVRTLYLPEVLVVMRAGGISNASFRHRLVANKEDRRAWQANNLKPRWYTLWLKPLSKIMQLVIR